MCEHKTNLAGKTDGLRARATYQGYRLTDIELKIEQLEREQRRSIMIIEGVEDNKEISSPEIVDDLFADLKLDFDSHVCDRIYRKGKHVQKTPGTGAGPDAAE